MKNHFNTAKGKKLFVYKLSTKNLFKCKLNMKVVSTQLTSS